MLMRDISIELQAYDPIRASCGLRLVNRPGGPFLWGQRYVNAKPRLMLASILYRRMDEMGLVPFRPRLLITSSGGVALSWEIEFHDIRVDLWFEASETHGDVFWMHIFGNGVEPLCRAYPYSIGENMQVHEPTWNPLLLKILERLWELRGKANPC